MRIYANCNDAITDIGRELRKCASTVHTQTYQNKDIANDPNFETKEIQAFAFSVIDSSDKDTMPNVTLEWANAEFDERVSGQAINPGEAYKLRHEVWDEFLVENPWKKEGKQFDYTYPERMYWQLDAVVKELKAHPQTRQAIIQVHNRKQDQDKMGKSRVPCSMYYHFMFRDGKLDVIYNMRSTDFATHFQNDIWLAIRLQEHIAAQINQPVGKFIMFASSLHIYKKDWELLTKY